MDGNQRPRCKQRGIKLAALPSSGVFDLGGSLARGNKNAEGGKRGK